MASRMNTFPRVQARRQRAADRLESALAPDSTHVFGTWKRFALHPNDSRASEEISDAERSSAQGAARKDAEACLTNLRRNNVVPAGE